jgi:hypothetical protein
MNIETDNLLFSIDGYLDYYMDSSEVGGDTFYKEITIFLFNSIISY